MKIRDWFRQSPAPRAADAESVTRLAGGVAHDLSNILLVVQGYVELALGEKDLGPGARAHLEEVLSALRRSSELAEQLLAVGRRAPATLSAVDLNAVVEKALADAGAGPVSFSAGADLPVLQAAKGQVERCIGGLVAFARERTRDGGRLFIETRLEADSRIVLHLAAPEALASDDELANLFEPFYVSPATGRRLGLALAAARGIVTVLGGEISVRGIGSGGFELTAVFPVQENRLQAAAATGNATVLLAEDDPGIRETAFQTLEKEGFRVLAAADGEEAVLIFERSRSSLRVAILDDVMPRRSGRAVIQHIRRRAPSLPIILCTGYAWGAPEPAQRLPVNEILAKPYQPRDLLRCLRRVLDGRR